jgi:hypothetical protein
MIFVDEALLVVCAGSSRNTRGEIDDGRDDVGTMESVPLRNDDLAAAVVAPAYVGYR